MLPAVDQPLEAQHLQAAGFKLVVANEKALVAVGQCVREAVNAQKAGVGALLLHMLEEVDEGRVGTKVLERKETRGTGVSFVSVYPESRRDRLWPVQQPTLISQPLALPLAGAFASGAAARRLLFYLKGPSKAG